MSLSISMTRKEPTTMTQTDRDRQLYRITVTLHGIEHAGRVGSDLAAALSEPGLAARASDVRSDSARRLVVVVFDALEASEVPTACAAQNERDALRDFSLLSERPGALLPVLCALLALRRARETSTLPPHRQMTVEIEPWPIATEAMTESNWAARDEDPLYATAAPPSW